MQHKGRAVLVLWLPSSTSRLGTLPTTRESLSRLAAEVGLGATSASGRLRCTERGLKCVISSHGLCVKYLDRALAVVPSSRVRLGTLPVVLGQDIDCIVSAQAPASFRNVGDLLRAPNNPTASTTVTVVAATSGNVASDRYMYVTPEGDIASVVPYPASVVVDQSVLIDAERALAGRLDEDNLKVLRDQLAWLALVDTVPGFGIREAARASVSGAHSLACAWMAWMSLEPGNAPLAAVRGVFEEKLKQPLSPLLSDIDDEGRSIDESALGYLAILEAVRPWLRVRDRKYVASERADAYLDWHSSMNHESGGYSAHASAAILRLLLGRGGESNDVARMLKLSKRPPFQKSALHGAAFDLFYLSIVDMSVGGALDIALCSSPYFLTADKPLAQARAATVLSSVVESESWLMPLMRVDLAFMDRCSGETRKRIQGAQEQTFLDSQRRLAMGDRSHLISEHVLRVESELVESGLLA